MPVSKDTKLTPRFFDQNPLEKSFVPIDLKFKVK